MFIGILKIIGMIKSFSDNWLRLTFFLGGHSLYLVLDQTVDLYKSNLVIDTFSLFTHVGGIMGFCKEILWILLIIFSGFDYARRYFSV